MMRRLVGCVAVLLATCTAAGCFDSSSGAGGSAGVPKPEANAAEQLLNQMISAYQQADSYADRGELRIMFRRDGQLFESKVPFSVWLARPNKLQMHLYQGHVVCDGTQLWGWTDDLPGFILKRQMSSALTLGDLYADEVLEGVLNRGQVGGSLQLEMLLGGDAMAMIVAGGERPELLADDEIDGRPCRRVRVRREDGNFTYWIDAQTLVLRRIEYPTKRALRMAAFASATELTMKAEFVDPVLNPQLAGEAFEFEPPPTVKVVERLDPFAAIPPPPPLASTLGTPLGDFRVTGLDDKPRTREDLAGKTAVVLFWSLEQNDSYGALSQVNLVYEQFRSQPDLAFLAVNIDNAGEQGYSDAEVREALERRQISVPTARDDQHLAVRAFDVQFVPSLFLVAKNGTIEDNEIGLNPELHKELGERLKRLQAGESLVADAKARYQQRVTKFEEAQRAAGTAVADVGNLPQSRIAPAREPQQLKMTRLWRNDEVGKPGYVLPVDDDKQTRILVGDGLRGVAELDAAGKLVRKVDLDLPTSPSEAVVSFWRTARDKDGKRVFVASASAQQQLHVFDADFKRLVSFPDGTHAGISDVQVGDLDGDGEPELCVGYWDVVGVQGVSLDGHRLWSNRRLPENVLRLALTPETPRGKRRLLCNTGLMTIAVLDEAGSTLAELPVGARSLRLVAAADLKGDGSTALCGIATEGPGSDTAVGFDVTGAELWNYPLPRGVHPVPELQNEMLTFGKLLPDEPGMWIFAAADGTLHFVGADGKPLDSLAWGEALHGVGVGALDGRPTLFLSDSKSVSALQFAR